MFNILNVCNDYILGNILSIIKRTVDLLGIIVPILLIIGGTINIAKGVLNPEDKKAIKSVVNCFVSAIIVFFLPFIVNTTMTIISVANNDQTKIGITENGTTQTFNVAECWNNAKTVDITPKFNSVNEKTNTSLSKEQNNNTKGNSSTSGSAGNSGNKGSSTAAKKQPITTNTTTTNQKFEEVVVIGDSRFVWLRDEDAKKDDKRISYIAEGSKGFEYLKSQISNIKSKDNGKKAFVINLGVNDLYRTGIEKQYISYINNMTKDIKGKIYYMSVNPVIEDMAKQNGYNTGWVNNANINKFNAAMKAGLNNKITYLDSNTYLKVNGFGKKDTFDGIHYYGPTYEKIKNYILTQLNIK